MLPKNKKIRVSPLDKVMSIKTNTDLLRLVKLYAEVDGLSMNQVINMMLWKYVGCPPEIDGKKIIKIK